jgi:DNA helicase-2/ATP-dependent DNA helicase PcrA
MNVYEGLNPEQAAAVAHNEGPLLVVAGAGTGKTQVITRRIARLVEEKKAKPSQILALTFTEKAAREMAERLEGMIGWDAVQVPVMTFHAFGTEILRNYASHINRSVRGGLLNDTQKTLLLFQHIDRIKLSYYGGDRGLYEFLETVTRYIGNLQNDGIDLIKYRGYVAGIQADPGEMHLQDIAEQVDLLAIYDLYEAIKLETGHYDHADQLLIPLQILNDKPNIAERLRRQYQYVLVDEYQDTNTVQDGLLRQLVAEDGNLFAVGDDDQAIYGFRGARIENILEFVEHFKVEQPVALNQNYRSGQEILDASYRLIQHNNPERLEARLSLDKRLIGQREGSTVIFTPYAKQADEYAGVLDALAAQIKAGVKADDMAVLAATHAPLKQIAKGLRERNIPYALSTSANIFEQTELLQLWYLLDWIGERVKPESITHLVLGAYIGWSPEDYRFVNAVANEQSVSFEEALRLSETAQAHDLVSKLDTWREWSREYGVTQLAYKLVFETGVSDKLVAEAATNNRSLRVFEDLDRLFGQMQDYESVSLDGSLVAYQAVFPKPPTLEVKEPVGAPDGIQLLTVHASKGLEFPIVYLMGLTQRSWSEARGGGGGIKVPEELQRSSDLPPAHEYRRQMYVALTRAKDALYLSAPVQTASGSKQTITAFVEEAGIEQGSLVSTEVSTKTEAILLKLQRYYPLKEMVSEAKLPFETEDGWIELSVTALSGYEYCPYDFYLQHVLGIHHPAGPQMAFGTMLHAVFEAYYKAQLNGLALNLDELRDILDSLWNEHGYDTAEAAAQAHASAHDTLKFFYERELVLDRSILGSEVSISFEIPEAKLRLRGKIDAYFDTPEGVELRDFKTGRKTDPEKLSKDAKDNFQLRTYALAYELLKGQLPAQVTLDYVVTGVEGNAEMTRRLIDNHREKLIKFADQIRAREFSPNTNAFHTCAATMYYGNEEGEL